MIIILNKRYLQYKKKIDNLTFYFLTSFRINGDLLLQIKINTSDVITNM